MENVSMSSDDGEADKAMIRGYAQRYLTDILKMLDRVPRQMLLLFKMNDCLRHVESTLGVSHGYGAMIAGGCAARTVYEDECHRITTMRRDRDDDDDRSRRRGDGERGSGTIVGTGGGFASRRRLWLMRPLRLLRAWASYFGVLVRIRAHDVAVRWTGGGPVVVPSLLV